MSTCCRDPLVPSLQTVEEWVSVLDLATLWDFETIRQGVIARLRQTASTVDRICVARRFDIEGWIQPAYIELCRRPASLTLAENTKLGMETATLLADVRVKMRDFMIRKGPSVFQDAQIVSLLDAVQREILGNNPAGNKPANP